MTPETLSRAMGGSLPLSEYKKLAPPFTIALQRSRCDTVERAAMFCAQVGHESAGLYYREEIHSGSNYEGRRDLGNTEKGDGVRFKGRGPIQLTGRHNYTEMSKWAHKNGYSPTSDYFVKNPSALEKDEYLFLGTIWYWTVARDLNSYSDKRDIVGATRAINGGTNHLGERTIRWKKCLAIGKALLEGDTDMAYLSWPKKDREAFLDDIANAILKADIYPSKEKSKNVTQALRQSSKDTPPSVTSEEKGKKKS